MKDYPLLLCILLENGLLTIKNGLLTEEIETTNGRIMHQTLLC